MRRWEVFAPDPIGYGSYLVSASWSRRHPGPLTRRRCRYALDWLSERTRVISSGWASGIEARVVRAAERRRGRRESVPRVDRAPLWHPRCDSSSPGLTFSTANGCAANVAASTPGSICAPHLRRSPARAPRRSRAGAERELLATGERARKRTVDTLDQLTPQEIADRAPRRERTAPIERSPLQLFISPSTVEYHLRKAFRKLGSEVADGAGTPDGVVVLWLSCGVSLRTLRSSLSDRGRLA